MADIDYGRIVDSIVEAMDVHDNNANRRPNAQQKLQKESLEELRKILRETVKASEKQQKSNEDLKKSINKAISEDKSGKFLDKDGNFGFGSKWENKVGGALEKIATKGEETRTKLASNFWIKALTALNNFSDKATDTILKSLTDVNMTGLSYSMNDYKDAIRGSTMQLDTWNKQVQKNSITFAAWDKSTGNALKSFNQLGTQLAEWGNNNGMYTTDEDAAGTLTTYLEMQRQNGVLDKISQDKALSESQNMLKEVRKISQIMGLNREEALENAKKNKEARNATIAGGLSSDTHMALANALEFYGEGTVQRELLEQFLDQAPRELATNMTSQIGDWKGNQLSLAELSEENAKALLEYLNSGQTAELARQYAENNKNSHRLIRKSEASPVFGGIFDSIKYANMGREKEDADSITGHAKKDLSENRLANSKTALAAKGDSALKIYDALTTTTNNILSSINEGIGSMLSKLDSITGGLSGGLVGGIAKVLSVLSDIANIVSVFRGFGKVGKVAKWGWNLVKGGGRLLGRAGKAGWSAIKAVGRGARGAGRGIANAAKWGTNAIKGAKVGAGALKWAGRAAKGAGIGLAFDLAGEAVDRWGAKGLTKIGVGEKTAKNVANYGSAALKGAGYGAAIGSIIPGIGTAVGGLVGAGVGLLAQGGKDLWDWFSRRREEKKAKEAEEKEKKELEAQNETDEMLAESKEYYNDSLGAMGDMNKNLERILFALENNGPLYYQNI